MNWFNIRNCLFHRWLKICSHCHGICPSTLSRFPYSLDFDHYPE